MFSVPVVSEEARNEKLKKQKADAEAKGKKDIMSEMAERKK